MRRTTRGLLGLSLAAALTAIPAVAAFGTAAAAPPPATASGGGFLEATKAASARAGVPIQVLLAVSYLESRWDDHAGKPSTSGGFGPMHLTDVAAVDGKGDGSPARAPAPGPNQTVDLAARLTGADVASLKRDVATNLRGGALVLADYQRAAGHEVGATSAAGGWYGAVARYSGAGDEQAASSFADRVFALIAGGQQRRIASGEVVTLRQDPAVQPRRSQLAQLGLTPAASAAEPTDCPKSLDCEWIPAPYEWYGAPNPGAYGNHDLADRPKDMKIDYIVIHNTEGTYDTALGLVQDPTYLGWHYTIRSADGHVAQHIRPHDVGWHAGNWYVNAHSIGIEHEGFAAQGATWYTEAMYESSAALVAFLADRYGIRLDREHIIGHDQVPGTVPSTVAGMHWDPGPYWDWKHYFDLLGAPFGNGDSTKHNRIPKAGDVVRITPDFDANQQPMTGCDTAGVPCQPQGTNFVALHTAPSADSPLVADVGLHPDGSASTTAVSDIGARASAGVDFSVAARTGSWTGISYLGQVGWFFDPSVRRTSTTLKARGPRVVAKPGTESVPVYGRAYPERAAYPGEIPYQTVVPLQYTIPAGQAYPLADSSIKTDFYYANTFDDSLPGDHTDVVGKDRYYLISFGHRVAYVRATDVKVLR